MQSARLHTLDSPSRGRAARQRSQPVVVQTPETQDPFIHRLTHDSTAAVTSHMPELHITICQTLLAPRIVSGECLLKVARLDRVLRCDVETMLVTMVVK